VTENKTPNLTLLLILKEQNMAKGIKGSRFHPARISGKQKFLRAKEENDKPKKKRTELKPLDLSRQNWRSNP
jgi:hypothetical protein